METLLTDGRHRYYFDIRNHDQRPFSGTVSITLAGGYHAETFATTAPLEPGLGTFVAVEVGTAPGNQGVTGFSFTASVNGEVVALGEGPISGKLVNAEGE